MKASPRLDSLERWMQAVVMHPGGAQAGWRSRPAQRLLATRDPASVVLPSKQLSSTERLEIYAHMYYARLVEVMEAEYPTVRQLLGPAAFAAACRALRGEASVAVAVVEWPERGLPRLPRPDTAALAPPRACRGHRAHRAGDGRRVRRARCLADDGGGVRGSRADRGEGAAAGQPGARAARASLPGERIHERVAPRRAAAHPAPAGDAGHRLPARVPGLAPRRRSRSNSGCCEALIAGKPLAPPCARASAVAQRAPIASRSASAAGSRNGPAPTCS